MMKRILNGKLKQFNITMNNKPGALADLCEKLANGGVNIKAIATDAEGVRVVTSDEQTTRNLLTKAKHLFDEDDVLQLKLLDRPGELAKISRMLANEKINIDHVYLLGGNGENTDIIIKVSDTTGALKVLT